MGGSRAAASSRQDAQIGRYRGVMEWLQKGFRRQTYKVAPVAEHNLRFERQSSEQLSAELCSRSGFANDQCARSTHIHGAIVTEFFREDAVAKPSVAANVDAPEEDSESHSGIIEKKVAATPLHSRKALG